MDSIVEALQSASVISQLPWAKVILTMLVALALSAYVSVIYRLATSATFFSRDFSVTVGVIGLMTAGIVLAMQTSLLVSMGMVGALSIVRFRTALKSPKDLLFLFWSIGTGMICGCGLYGLALLCALGMTLGILFWQWVPLVRQPYLVVVNARADARQKEILDCIRAFAPHFRVKSRVLTANRLELVAELRVRDEQGLMEKLKALASVESVSVLSHDGDLCP